MSHSTQDGYDHADLCTCLVDGLAGEFHSRAAGQLLGFLSKATPADAPLLIAKNLQTTSVNVRAAWSTYEAGKVRDHVLVHSVAELWSWLRKPDALHGQDQNGQVVSGRLIQIRSLPSMVVLQLLTTLMTDFDVELLFSQLISRGQSVGGRMSHTGPHPASGQCWSFTMKYYYLNDGIACSYGGQESGPLHEKAYELYICRGTSIITINLRSKHSSDGTPGTSARKQWTCLILSTNQQIERKELDFASHTEAFLWAVGQEMSWARRELRRVSQQIALLAVPSDEFLFNEAYRNSLIFEDSSYSNSKTYFWALQSLRTVNDCINHLLAAWEAFDNFSLSDFLKGQDGDAPSTTPPVPKGNNVSFLEHIEAETARLKSLQGANLARQEEIESLRDGLFNASNVLEARTTVLQGRNIELLTYISMVFLPASFVTSVFGMDVLGSSVSIRDFAAIFVVVCGVTYATIIFFRLGVPFRRLRGA